MQEKIKRIILISSPQDILLSHDLEEQVNSQLITFSHELI